MRHESKVTYLVFTNADINPLSTNPTKSYSWLCLTILWGWLLKGYCQNSHVFVVLITFSYKNFQTHPSKTTEILSFSGVSKGYKPEMGQYESLCFYSKVVKKQKCRYDNIFRHGITFLLLFYTKVFLFLSWICNSSYMPILFLDL